MVWQGTNSRLPAEPAAVVEAPTLKEALRLVRTRYGQDARVIRSRTVTRRQSGGLGQRKLVEVLIRPADRGHERQGAGRAVADADRGRSALVQEIAGEVARIEDLVRKVAARQTSAGGWRRCRDNPAAAALVAAGADPGVVVRLGERCQAETGADPRDQDALLAYLARNLATVRGGWDDLAGTHVFLGPAGAGRSELVYRLAALLGERQRQVLVLGVLPRHAGEVRRLQETASDHGFDAAVIQKPRQLAAAAEHLASYDVVLLDAPALGAAGGPQAAEIHRALMQQTAYHRHLVFPLDRDLRDSQPLLEDARHWNCDWLALSRVDQSDRRAKVLDLLERLPLPVSVVADAAWPLGAPHLASPALLIELMLGAARHRAAGGA